MEGQQPEHTHLHTVAACIALRHRDSTGGDGYKGWFIKAVGMGSSRSA